MPPMTICVTYREIAILTETTDMRLTLMEKTDPSLASDSPCLLTKRASPGWGQNWVVAPQQNQLSSDLG